MAGAALPAAGHPAELLVVHNPTPSPAQTLDELLPPVLERAYGYALSLAGNAADAEDLLQEAALAACRGFGTFRPGSRFKPWFFAILTNCHYARHRRSRREGEQVDLEDVPDLYLFERTQEHGLHHRVADPATLLLGRLDREQVDAALRALPEEFRLVATLYFMDDLTYADIAEVVGVPVGTVRSRLHRGRRLLQRRLWDVAIESGIVAQLDTEAP
jgi:RNA polymerase sigma-70 factor (ECF subfamily)